jgi:hypothetical protein
VAQRDVDDIDAELDAVEPDEFKRSDHVARVPVSLRVEHLDNREPGARRDADILAARSRA